jgi:hypothetical protein
MSESLSQSGSTALDFESMASDVVALAIEAGAADAEDVAREGLISRLLGGR